MKELRSIAVVFALSAAAAMVADQAVAQDAPQIKHVPAAKRHVAHVAPKPVAPPPPPSPLQTAQIEQKCLRALNGACTNPISVEQARLRAEIIPAVRLSYTGTPAGTIGGSYIPYERLFQDNTFLFGLPTFTTVFACCIARTK